MLLKCCYTLDLADPSKRVSGLSKEVMYVLADQNTAKLQAHKVCAIGKSNPGRSITALSRRKLQKYSLGPKMTLLFFDRQL